MKEYRRVSLATEDSSTENQNLNGEVDSPHT